jgi:hypothetical protein
MYRCEIMQGQVVCDDGRIKIEYDKGEVRNMNGCWMTICHPLGGTYFQSVEPILIALSNAYMHVS